MIIFTVMKKTAKQTRRHSGRRTLVFILPIIFFSFFGFAFGAPDEGVTRMIGYVDDDLGYAIDFSDIIPDEFLVSENQSTFGELYIDLMQNHPDILVNTSIEIELIRYDSIDELVKDAGFKKIDMRIDEHGIFTVSLAVKE